MNRQFFTRFAMNAVISFCLAFLGTVILSLIFDREDARPDETTHDSIELVQNERIEE